MSGPQASTATGTPFPSRQPRCAVPSIPSANPLTTGTPAAPRPRPSAYAASEPYGLARRVPTTATAGSSRRSCSASALPNAKSTAGGSLSCWRRVGSSPPGRKTASPSADSGASRSASSSSRSRNAQAPSAASPAAAATKSSSDNASSPATRVAGRSSRPAMRGARCATRKARRRHRSHASIMWPTSRRDRLPPVEAIGEGLVQLAHRYSVTIREVGDRPRDAQDAVVRPPAQARRAPHREETCGENGVERHLTSGKTRIHVAVAQSAGAGEPCPLAFARPDDAPADDLGGRPSLLSLVQELHRRHRLDLTNEVDAVQERPAQAPQVSSQLDVRAGTPVRRACARAPVAGRHDRGVGRKLEHALTSSYLDSAVLERLSQGVDRSATKLGKLVQEEHSAVGKGDLAGSRRAASAHQALGGDPVVRRPKGALGRKPSASNPGCAMDLSDFQRLLERRRRKDARKSAGEHRLAGPRRPDHQEVVTPRGGDLERPLGVHLTPDIGEIGGVPKILALWDRRPSGLGGRPPVHEVGQPCERRDPIDLDAVHERSLGRIGHRNEQARVPGPPRSQRGTERATNGP